MSDSPFIPVDVDDLPSAFTPVSLEEVEALRNAPRPKRGSQTKIERLWGQRTNQNWFQLTTSFEECEFCEHTHMCATSPEGKIICRRCYVVFNDKKSPGERETHDPPS